MMIAVAERFSPIRGIYTLQTFIGEFGSTIVNAFDVDAWKRATALNWLGLRLVVRSGHVKVALRNITADGSVTELHEVEQDGSGVQVFPRIKLSEYDGALMPFITYAEPESNYDIVFVTDDTPVTHNLRINYIFCTFKRASYVQHNTNVFRDYVRRNQAQCDAHLTIIDNGSTPAGLDCGVEADENVSTFANNNTGGAGGFGRGIYESCYGELAGEDFTHVCLLDDDIYLHREMFARNTAFMRFLKPGFHVGAPMYPASSEKKVPRLSACFGHKYRGSVHPSDTAIGAGLDTSNLPDFINMDRHPDSTGWWWSCFATSDVHRIGLPYPFFIKMDDVEYGLRLRDSGVELVIPYSFWVLHDDFEEKYSAAMQYFRFRNRWVLLSLQNRLGDTKAFIDAFSRLVRDFVVQRQYEHAQLLLNAMTHFLEGPQALIEQEKKILKGIFSIVKNEKNAPMFAPPDNAEVINELDPPKTYREKRINELSMNGHFRPSWDNVAIDTSRHSVPTDCRNSKRVTYWNAQKCVGYTVTRNSRRALNLMRQLSRIRRAMKPSLQQVAERYRRAKPHLTSTTFWADYGKFGRRQVLSVEKSTAQVMHDLTVRVAHLQSQVTAQAPSRHLTDSDFAALNALRNHHLGKRCFVLGNGPSLTTSDMELLRNEVTFAANKIYLAFDQTSWRPTYYSVEDLLVAKNCREEILAVDVTTKIFAHHMLPYFGRQPNHIYARWLPPMDNKSPFREFSTDLTKGICWGSTITYSMIQMAVFMGFREIYILGLDHSYIEPDTKENGALVHSGEVNHFHPEYRKKGERWHYPVLDRLEHSYAYAKTACDKLGVSIYNASRFSKLEIFPKVSLDDVMGITPAETCNKTEDDYLY